MFSEGSYPQKVGVSEEVSCLKRTVSVWLSVMTDAEPLGDVAFIADGPPVERLPLLHSP